jgi:methyltransferase
LALHLPLIALVFTILNAVVLVIRIRAEGRALATLREFRARSAS